MKKKLIFAGFLVLISWSFTSCLKDNCKVCKQVTYVDGTYDHEGNSNEYCGASLIAIEAMNDVVIGNTRTAWECN